MSDDTDDDVPLGQASSRRKIKRRILSSDSSSSSTNCNSPILRTRINTNYRVVSDDSDSDSSDSFRRYSRKRKKIALITSDSGDGSDSSDSIIIRKVKRVANIIESDPEDAKCTSSQWETDDSDPDEPRTAERETIAAEKDSTDYDSTGQQSEECPICLAPIRKQELGSPESCDHLFCLACILEWSKNVNTCPIDRQEYRLVFVKRGTKIVRKIPIERPAVPEGPPEDPICCEICGSGDREDRLLLCDGCDLGFHLECLTPALSEVPLDAWYCNVCRSDDGDFSPMGFTMPDETFMRILRVNMGPRRTDTRLIPRTGQTERVISRILNHRSSAEQEVRQPEQPSSSSRETARKRTKKKGKKKAKRKYRMVYEVDDKTGEVVSKKKQVRVGRGKRKKRTTRRNRAPKTVKKRLAQQLGICNAQPPNQNLPDVRAANGGHDGLSNQRYQAGIPTLHLFGQRDELDYFSAAEEDVGGGPDYLVRRRANHSDVAAFRRAARRKGVALPQIPTSSPSADLLGSIINSQTQFFAKDVKLSVDDSGRLKIEKTRPDLNNSDDLSKKTPYGGNNRNQRRNTQSYPNAPYQGGSYYPYDSYGPSSTSGNYTGSFPNSRSGGVRGEGGGYDQDVPQDYTQSTLSSYDRDPDSEHSQRNEQGEDSDIDIYSDIEESVSTSKMDEDNAAVPAAPSSQPNNGSDVDNNDSENEMVIDTEKVATPTQDEEEEAKEEETAVTSSEDTVAKAQPPSPYSATEPVESSFHREEEEEEDEDGCPNFNIYSSESIDLAKNTDVTLNPDQVVSSTPLPEPPIPPPELIGAFAHDEVYDPEVVYDPEAAYNSEKDSEPPVEDVYDPERDYDTAEDTVEPEKPEERRDDLEERVEAKKSTANALYSDSEDEEVVKISRNSFVVGDISAMTEDVSEEERSYTPCLDEKASENRGKGLDDLGTEMISDDEKNDFDESHEHKTASEGDALEINAKESEIDMVRPEDYEEGEIVDKNKANKEKQEEKVKEKETEEAAKPENEDVDKNKPKKKEDKKNEGKQKQESFKKLSKSNKERNYRDKEKSGKEDKSKNKENSREKRKRKEIERYDVRALIAEKPRRLKDKFGRDIRKSSSKSRSRSYTPKMSPDRRTPPRRLSADSRERKRKKRSRSRRRSSESRSKSRQRHRSESRSRRRRSRSRSKRKKKSKDRSKRRKRERSSSRTYTPTRKRRKEWQDRLSRERGFSAEARWTPSVSRSPEVEQGRHVSTSWTPPRTLETTTGEHRGLTVILQNDQNKKKKDKRKKNGKKGREVVEKRTKRKKKEQTPPPSKEVFASGDNILVSVSFNKENERRERDVFTKKKKEAEDKEKKKRSMRRKKKNQELSTIKPVAIIDLERSPFRELTPSPKDVIVLSDEDHVENSAPGVQDVCDSSQQVASPETVPVYMTGPKTPPEPQVKFTLPSKQQALRPLLSNPLHDPEDDMVNEGEQEEEEDGEMRELGDTHKGPNTPPEPPNSPPSSPDAYDPFEPTKSRSPSPDQVKTVSNEDVEKRNDISTEKNAVIPSLTPPLADIQPADSQSSLMISRESSKSPDQGNRSAQQISKSQTLPFAPAGNALTTSTPLPPTNSAGAGQRINILSSTILGNVSSSIPQRGIVLPNVKLSPVKNAVKSQTTVKGAATSNAQSNKSKGQNGNETGGDVISLDFDSPYSPGSSDYEDLFEPPPEVVTKKTLNKSASVAPVKETPTASSAKPKNAFDSLFDTPVNKLKKIHVSLDKSKGKKTKGTKIVGVKLDEDHLKILDELPNSAVEMQVKDKFLKKLNRQERVVEEVKLVLKPYYNKKKIDKEEYKDIMRRAVPKICHNKSGEINPTRIKNLVEAYVKKIRHSKPKVTSSSSYNPLKG